MTQPRFPRPAAPASARRSPVLWAALLVAVALIAIPTVRAGQTASDARRARDTATVFLQAFTSGDRAGVEANVTQAARAKMDGIAAFFPTRQEGSFTVGEPTITIETDRADVSATLTQANGDATDARLALVRENGQWRVRSLVFILAPGGPTYTLNLEHPENAVAEGFRTLGQGVGLMARSMADGMEAFAQGFRQGLGEPREGQNPQNHNSENSPGDASPRIEEVTPAPK